MSRSIRYFDAFFLSGRTTLILCFAMGLAMLSNPVRADHDTEHSVANLKGGLGAVEQRLWDCENGVGACLGNHGPEGPQGETGPVGPQGETGSVGPQGPLGPQGATGAKGDTGNAGAAGPLGPQGESGSVGPQGPLGEQGATGAKGDTGAAGSTGAQGAKGDTGNTGAAGSQGPQGSQGEAGVQGDPGIDGLSCWDLNDNGEGDSSEDINGDGAVDILDCAANVDLTHILSELARLTTRLHNSDFDGDGYSPADGDCDDAEIRADPTNYEIVDDGVDNDCDGTVDLASTTADFDGDGLTDSDEENIYFTNATLPDTDNDSLGELYRARTKLSCYTRTYSCGTWGLSTCSEKICQTVGDGYDYFPPVDMSDGNEVNVYSTDPNLTDTDGDGVNDGQEIRNGTNPNNPDSL